MSKPDYILLEDWAALNLAAQPTLLTLRRWAREGMIDPAPFKVGKAYYVERNAKPPPEQGTLRAQVAAAPTFLYRHFDGHGRLLYVGVSLSPLMRTSDHRVTAKWYATVRTIRLEPHPNRAAALAAEKAAIKTERPLHNTHHTTR